MLFLTLQFFTGAALSRPPARPPARPRESICNRPTLKAILLPGT
jgi:hypothetical protein